MESVWKYRRHLVTKMELFCGLIIFTLILKGMYGKFFVIIVMIIMIFLEREWENTTRLFDKDHIFYGKGS
jgi:hypothetical protein